MSEFRCARCRLVFERGRAQEEALADGVRVFGEEAMLPGRVSEVCAKCYEELMLIKEYFPDVYERAKEADRIKRSN